MAIWYRWLFGMNYISVPPKKMVSFLRTYKGKWSETWNVLCKGFNVLRNRICKVLSDLTNLRKHSFENVRDYITRAESMPLNLSDVDRSISENILLFI